MIHKIQDLDIHGWKARAEAAETALADKERIIALCAADTTAADLRQTIAFIEAVLDRYEDMNNDQEEPYQMVDGLIKAARYQMTALAGDSDD